MNVIKFLIVLQGLIFSSITLVSVPGSNGLIQTKPAQAESLEALIGKNILIARSPAIASSLVGKYVGSLKTTVAGSCGAPSKSSITIIVSKNGDVSSTTKEASGPNGVSAQLSTSVSPPLFTGQYTYNGWQGFWQGQIVGSEIIGRAGVYNCRFIFSDVKKI